MVPLVTPRNDGRVDNDSLRSLLEFQVARCVDSIFVIGTTGEFQYLSIEEKKEVIQVTSEVIDQRFTILVGISSPSVDEMLSLITEAQKGQALALVLAPMYGDESPEYLIDKALENSSLPILLYNNPQIHHGESLPVGIVEEYSSHPNITGIKDSSGDWDYFTHLLEMQNQRFSVLQGRESQILKSLQAGADGIVAGAANVNPEPFCDIILSPDEEIMREIMEVKENLNQLAGDSIPAIKMKLVEMGIMKKGWIEEQLTAERQAERAGYHALLCLHVEVWLQSPYVRGLT